MDEHSTWYTQSGENITLYVEQEAGTCYVSVESDALGYIQFNFNPDFPQDATAFAWAEHIVFHSLSHPDRWEIGNWGIRSKRKRKADVWGWQTQSPIIK